MGGGGKGRRAGLNFRSSLIKCPSGSVLLRSPSRKGPPTLLRQEEMSWLRILQKWILQDWNGTAKANCSVCSVTGQHSILKTHSFQRVLPTAAFPSLCCASPGWVCLVNSLPQTDPVPSWEHTEVNCGHWKQRFSWISKTFLHAELLSEPAGLSLLPFPFHCMYINTILRGIFYSWRFQ